MQEKMIVDQSQLEEISENCGCGGEDCHCESDCGCQSYSGQNGTAGITGQPNPEPDDQEYEMLDYTVGPRKNKGTTSPYDAKKAKTHRTSEKKSRSLTSSHG